MSQLQESTKKTPLLYDFNQSTHALVLPFHIEFLIESFDGASLMDSGNEGEEEAPLRNARG